MYLEHFNFQKLPFALTPNTDFFCELPTHREALNVILLSLQGGEGFIKITGEVGTGKTLICRLLLNSLDDSYVTAYIPNPDQSADSLRLSLASELGLKLNRELTQHQVLEAINHRLLELHMAGKRAVLIMDEAQAFPDSCLEAIRLLTNLETEERKLLQVVLFGQPELDTKLAKNALRQLLQRITFSYVLRPLAAQEVNAYIVHRLTQAGYTYGELFTAGAKKRLTKASRGLPRLLNILCHKSLLVSYGMGQRKVGSKAVNRAIQDTESVAVQGLWAYRSQILLFCAGIALAISLFYSKLEGML